MSTKGRAYVWIVIVTGCVAVAQSVFELLQSPPDSQWWILALMTLISGSATVKLPAISAHISVSETFLFSAVLIFGPSAGVAAVILDSLIITVLKLWKKQRSPEQVLFNLSAPALSMWVGAHLYYLTSGSAPLASLPPNTRVQISSVIAPLLLFAVVCFALNSGLVACAVAFQQKTSALAIWRKHFVWLSLNYFGGASVAALLVVYTRTFDWTFFGVTVPLILVLYMTFRASMARVADATRHLEELNALYLATVQTLAAAIDAKDQVTHGHIRRVQRYAVDLAKTIGVRDDMQLRAIQAAAVLHDTGKIAVPEAILNKPGPLDAEEFAIMKQHAAVGADIISSINFPYPVEPIVRYHHENWDGSGYPTGLVGTEIPIGARILAVVDCFDALTSDRPYRGRMTDAEALKIIVDRRGRMYDPLVVDAFLILYPTLRVEDPANEPHIRNDHALPATALRARA